ncbi:hypothetical protein C4K68_08020 [Pokkaliibacter plantistimulans]|uniref:Lipoprotein n=2 Tax=Pseudomonadota TaxID=1224 RepID=A0A2S5KSX4_9PROT|nr:hypothetical protein C4K68_08020 [Pokkaliibacter plantistimulans]
MFSSGVRVKLLGWLLLGGMLLVAQGCGVVSAVGSTASLAVDVVSIPVKVVGAGVDAVVGDDDDDD